MSQKAQRERRKKAQQVGEVILGAGIPVQEALLVLERYKGLRRRLAVADDGRTDVPTPRLPGVEEPSTDDERMALVKRGIKQGVETGLYEDWELVAFADAVAKDARAQAIDEWNNNLIPYQLYGFLLEEKISRICGIVIGSGGELRRREADSNRWMFLFSEKDIDDLAGYYAAMLTAAERIGVPAEDTVDAKPYILGIRNLINGHDTGQALIEAVATYRPPTPEQNLFITSRTQPGQRRFKVLDYLCARAKPYRMNGTSWPGIWDALLTELADSEGKEDQEALEWMDTGSMEALSKAYERREKRQNALLSSRTN